MKHAVMAGWITAMVVWVAAVGAGLAGLASEAWRPGSPGRPAGRWPGETRVPRAGDRPDLVLVLHARCPCSRASLAELERLLAKARDRLAVHVVIARPGAGGSSGDLERRAGAIRGVGVIVDDGGDEARRFGAETSGHALLYDRSGALLFSGGITPARGHEGDNAGRDAILALISGDEANPGADVFGCPLSASTARDRGEGGR